MSKIEEYRDKLRQLKDWEPFLIAESRLPGPRANLELVQAVADVGNYRRFEQLLAWPPEEAPTGTREEFLTLCGTVGLGQLVAEGDHKHLARLKHLASDPRWRVREGVAMALQRFGAVDMKALLAEMRNWAHGNTYEQRAAAAALCEPALLTRAADAGAVLRILDQVTDHLATATDRKNDGFRVLRKALAYCWSVAVVAAPEAGRPLMERWIQSTDRDVRWTMRQNLGKKRMASAGPDWVRAMQKALSDGTDPSIVQPASGKADSAEPPR